MDGRFIAYYRVSTAKQGRSGLGIDAQKKAVLDYMNGGNWKVLREFTEVESGKNSDRVELAKALQECRMTGATLVIAKLDRLSRDAHFLLGLDKAGVNFVAADMPDANRLTVGIMAVIAQAEREMISKRTKDALQASKVRRAAEGLKPLGGWRGGPVGDPSAARAARTKKSEAFAASLKTIVEDLRGKGKTLKEIAEHLTERGIRTPRGGAWSPMQVYRLTMKAALTRKED
jgi:DNA invertase Pin-like site-specific DNA recombinase